MRRLTTLLLALTTAGIAVTSVYLYVEKVETRSVRGLKTRPVVVATRFLPAGVSGEEILDAGAFEVRDVPLRYVQPGAISEPRAIASLTLKDDVATDEQLTAGRFAVTQQNAFLAQFPKGTEALSLPLDYVRGVSGHLQAGDRINAYATAEGANGLEEFLEELGIPSSIGVFSAKKSATRLLLEGILVVEVQNGIADGASGTQALSTMTLAVNSKDAAVLIQAQEKAKLWFTLVPTEEAR